jgi:hypothetical protein
MLFYHNPNILIQHPTLPGFLDITTPSDTMGNIRSLLEA